MRPRRPTRQDDTSDDPGAIDLDDLVDAPDAPPDSISRLMSDLGAQVVEERPRQ